jgi:signal transduction histidine kinase
LLELSRFDAGQEAMMRIRFDLSQTVDHCVELLRPLADERGISIQCELPRVDYLGDPERIAQVVTNLLTNAIEYNKPNGEVRVVLATQGGFVSLNVSDTGPGIAAEDLPRVFERFYRADKARSNASGHSGLGLAIAKAIVEAHGGRIDVSSEPGSPTTFTVRLPANVA